MTRYEELSELLTEAYEMLDKAEQDVDVEGYKRARSQISELEAELDELAPYDDEWEEPWEDPVQADAETLAMAGMGTDEDYGLYDSE